MAANGWKPQVELNPRRRCGCCCFDPLLPHVDAAHSSQNLRGLACINKVYGELPSFWRKGTITLFTYFSTSFSGSPLGIEFVYRPVSLSVMAAVLAFRNSGPKRAYMLTWNTTHCNSTEANKHNCKLAHNYNATIFQSNITAIIKYEHHVHHWTPLFSTKLDNLTTKWPNEYSGLDDSSSEWAILSPPPVPSVDLRQSAEGLSDRGVSTLRQP